MSNSSKRVDIVAIKMVKESSLLYKNRKILCSRDAYEFGRTFIEDADREKLIVCCLDIKCQPTTVNVVSIGNLNSSIVHPREVFKVAILSNAASILLFHNHPSGDPTPSNEDMKITNRLHECGKMLGIGLVDHIIIGASNYVSLKDKGII